MTDKLITIANFIEPFQADLARAKLESEGIKCFLAGENFVATYWLLSNADRGIKLQVRESEAEKALEVLSPEEGAGVQEPSGASAASEAADLRCPKCSSENIGYEEFSRKAFFLGILFLRFPLAFPKRSTKCRECGHVWKEE
jgi:DNA-directed RNA polymerase subunit M/transcription elongation factor TFIIS